MTYHDCSFSAGLCSSVVQTHIPLNSIIRDDAASANVNRVSVSKPMVEQLAISIMTEEVDDLDGDANR